MGQKRFITTCITVIGFLIVLSCQTASNIIFPATPIGTPQSISGYDGDWQGITSQNLKITFTVTRSEIINLKFRVTWVGAACVSGTTSGTTTIIEPTALATGNFTPAHPIENNTFTISKYADNVDGSSYTIMGTFSSRNMASGTLEYVASGTTCDGNQAASWTAEKTVP